MTDPTAVVIPTRDDNLVFAMGQARQHKSKVWQDLLKQHRGHPSFCTIQDIRVRELGFACSCSGIQQEFKLKLTELKELLPEAREAIQRATYNLQVKGNKARKRKAHKALIRSQALLYRYLTKEQKWTLRGEKSFFVKGKDGHTYEIHAAGTNNVTRYEDGWRKYKFCVVSKYEHPIPVYDLMLAQKLTLESDPRSFLDIAVTRDMITGDLWDNGKHIDNPDVELPKTYKERFGDTNWERHQAEAEAREEGRALAQGFVGDLLVHDICLNTIAQYDASYHHGFRGVGFVLNPDKEVVPSFDTPIQVPHLEDLTHTEVEECIIKLVTGVPAETYAHVAQVQGYFRRSDLSGVHVLMHPETDADWTRRETPPWVPGASVLGVRKILDVRVPRGRAWYCADAETLGFLVHWYEGNRMGFCIFNLSGVCIYNPDHAAQEDQEESSRQGEEARNQEAGRLSQGQGHPQGEGREPLRQ